MTSIRPAKPRWEVAPAGPSAATALGEFSVSERSDGFWRARLNDAPFPILYENLDQAKTASVIMARAGGHPVNLDMDWTTNDAGGISTSTLSGDYHIIPSQSIEGFFVMQGDQPADIPLGSCNEAKEACAQYLVFVWFALSEVV